MSGPMRPEELARNAHREYYARGGYPDDRLRWTVAEFLPECRGQRILEIGCGDGKLLSVLQTHNVVFGVDASATGTERCAQKGVEAYCLDVSSEPLPFPDGAFDYLLALETLEHLTNPYFAMLEMWRVLKERGKLICSIPNPWTGHPYLYPGLFEFRNFSKFLEQCGFDIQRIQPWQWAPRETFLPRTLRGNGVLKSRYVAGVARRLVERTWRAFGRFPWFCYWLWTFECVKGSLDPSTVLAEQASQTQPKGC